MIEAAVLPDRRRVLVRVVGEVRGPEFVAAMTGVLERAPHALRYDYVFDLTRYEGDVSHDDLAAFAQWLDRRFGTAERGGATTWLVSGDAGFRHWAPVMELQFRRRRFRWAPDMATAEAEIERDAAHGRACPPDVDAVP